MNNKFQFGDNWLNFSKKLNNQKIKIAENDLKNFIKINLKNKKFLDIGCGSGLSSLAAVNLGAKVVSFDIDKNSIKASKYLKKVYNINSKDWKILSGNVLNKNFLKILGKFDIIYCWGVLHHTGNMYLGLNNLILNSKKNTLLYLALYNDEGLNSKVWLIIKKFYNILPTIFFKKIFFYLILILNILIVDIFALANLRNFKAIKELVYKIKNYENSRGMTYINDQLDWIGGYPFEVAKPQIIINFFKEKKFKLIKVKFNKGYGNNMYLFSK